MHTVMWELEEGVAERKTPRHGSLIWMRARARRLRFLLIVLRSTKT
jgi:hypothetical protein